MQNLSLPEILVETERRGSSFDELLMIPEQDDWLYSDGKSTSCVAFVLEMYKAAGLFDPIGSSIQVTEFTVSLSWIIQCTYTCTFWYQHCNTMFTYIHVHEFHMVRFLISKRGKFVP